MDLRQQFSRHRKDNRLILAVLSGALLFFTIIYYVILQGRELPPDVVTDQLLLFVLRNINVLLILICLFVIFRNLVKIFVERRRGVLGSRFQTKLVATYVALSLVPVVLLFAYAAEIIQGSVENLFRSPVQQVLEYGNLVSQELHEQIQEDNQRAASRVVQRIVPIDLSNPASRLELGQVLNRSLSDEGLDLLLVYEQTELVLAVIDPEIGHLGLPDPGSPFLLTAVREGSATRVLDSPGQEQRLLLGASAVQRENAPASLVVAGTVLDPELAARSKTLVQAYQQYLRLEVQKPDLQATYLLMFLMITLVILLTSTWVGLYLAKRITVPIQALADGTRRIAAGDLEHRVDVSAGDELGVLVDSFNAMTTQLRDNKELLEQRNVELTDINRRLDEERDLIATILHNVAAGVISVDQDARVLTCNEAALEMLQQSSEEVLDKTLEAIWQDPERRKLLALFEYDPLGRSRRQVRLRLGGEWKTFELNLTTMYAATGEITGHVLVLEDLTEFLQAQQLATWNEAARRIAHEIKNPLTPIKLSAERLLKKYRTQQDDLGEALEEGVATIVREVEAMEQMVDEFSRFARMPQPQPTDVDLDDLFSEILKLYRDVKPGLELNYSVAREAQTARFDKEQMRGVLINLLDNAVEATAPPGHIELQATAQNGSILLSVEDSGRGIPASSKEKLFQPYFSTKGRGTGLGLAIVHRVVNDHNGTIRVVDNHPKGTIFRVELPQQ